MRDERWLVKSSGRILGPFTLEELIQHLRARTVSIIDEIRDPMTRWSFVREQPLLRDIVEQLRSEQEKHHDETQASFTAQISSTASVTENILQESEITPSPAPFLSEGSIAGRPITGQEKNISDQKFSQIYGSPTEMLRRSKEQVKQSRRRILYVIIALFSAVLLFGIYYSNRKSIAAQSEKGHQYIKMARDQKRIGDYAKALEFLYKAKQLVTLSTDDHLLTAAFILQGSGSTVEAARELQAAGKNLDPRSERERLLLESLVSLKEQKWNEALTSLNLILSANPADDEALHNIAILEFYQGHFASSIQTIDHLIQKGYRHSELTILRAFNFFSLTNGAPNREQRDKLILQIENEVQSSDELGFEKNLLLSALYIDLGKLNEAEQSLKKMWLSDPFDSRNYVADLYLDHQIMSGERWGFVCQKVASTFAQAEFGQAINSICFWKLSDQTQALQSLDLARKKLSKSQILTAVQSLLFLQNNQLNEAKALLRLQGDEYLGLFAKGQVCRAESDWDCAEKSWSEILQKNDKNPMAINGLAEVYKQRGNEAGAAELIRKGFVLAPLYKPFIRTRGDQDAN